MAKALNWTAEGAFAVLAPPRALEGAGVTAQPIDSVGLANVLARKGQAQALAARLSTLYGVAPPDGPRRAALGPIAFVGTAPGVWMAVSEKGPLGFAQDLAENLRGLASVCDQSDGYAVMRVSGLRVTDVLAKGVFIDLHPDAFPPGAAAVTLVAQVGLILWRREAEVFELLCFRSHAAAFWHWLEESAAEFGLAVLPPA